MLELKHIVKKYLSGDQEVTALNDVSLRFRENEFVSILGASGCGKTTMLNIVGGLDRYTSGDLTINGKSTKEFKDGDWDTYRNHSIGFVFQSYNLIPHQSVLSNVELALTLSGVSKSERRAKAIAALTKVGLGDQIHKRPNQMSGGQMQRVAIARALVNNPDILLADEPTGALDTHTSEQIMDLLKEVAENRLVIMVTHNPELAEAYSTRIIRLKDGQVIDDSNPVEEAEYEALCAHQAEALRKKAAEQKALSKRARKKEKKKSSMSFATALSLSLNNLMTKKGRTILTSFAGSIGIIGIALILSLSNGIQAYIDQVQEDTLSTYPLTISKTTTDYSAMLSAMTEVSEMREESTDPNKIYVDDSLGTMMSAMSATVENDLTSFKAHLDENFLKISDAVSDVQYTYDFDLQVFTADGKTQVSPTTIFENMGSMFSGVGEMMDSMGGMPGMSILSEMINNQELLDQQYELVGENSHWPTSANEVVLVVSKDNMISKMTLYMLGVLDQGELEDIMTDLMMNGEYDTTPIEPYALDDFIGMRFHLLNTSDFYEKTGTFYTVDGKQYPRWYDRREAGFDQESFVTEHGTELVISGIVRPKPGATATSITGALGYTKGLTDMILEKNLQSEIIKQQKETPNHSVLSGATFERVPYTRENIHDLIDRVGSTNMQKFYGVMTAMILNNPEYREMLNVNENTVAMFVGTMENKKQAQILGEMLEKALANNPVVQPAMPPYVPNDITALDMLFSAMKSVPGGLSSIDFTKDNVIDLLPLMSENQVLLFIGGMPDTDPNDQIPAIAGLKDICPADYMNGLYTTLNADMVNWTINEKSMMLLLPQMDDGMFTEFEQTLYDLVPDKDETFDSMLKKLGDAEKASPASINFYAKNFESKETIEAFIREYNDSVDEIKKLQYTDLVGVMMSSVSTIIDVISYVLIAFVSISLVVSSIMIGIITYISVLERTKEIGILRSIGASKRDISRVFNAETLIVGFAAGVFGILLTVLLCLPINAIIRALSGIEGVRAFLPWVAALVLVGISMFLTFIAGLIPSGVASKKDPVEALRTE